MQERGEAQFCVGSPGSASLLMQVESDSPQVRDVTLNFCSLAGNLTLMNALFA